MISRTSLNSLPIPGRICFLSRFPTSGHTSSAICFAKWHLQASAGARTSWAQTSGTAVSFCIPHTPRQSGQTTTSAILIQDSKCDGPRFGKRFEPTPSTLKVARNPQRDPVKKWTLKEKCQASSEWYWCCTKSEPCLL